ncbi:MAG: amidohydrolase family protein [Pseudomonadota bacterium]
MTAKLIKGKWVITDAASPAISDGAVLVEGDRIAATGTFDDLAAAHPDAAVIGSGDHAVMPGLINAHHHHGGITGIQHGVPDMLLESWIRALDAGRAGDERLDVLLSCARLLRSGVTSVVDMASGRGTPEAWRDTMSRALDAYRETGIRAAFTPGANDQGWLGVGPGACDDDFLKTLPGDLANAVRPELPNQNSIMPDDYLAIMDNLIAGVGDDDRVTVWYGPPGVPWITDRFYGDIADAARRHDTGLQTHVSESYYEGLMGPKFHGAPMMRHLHGLGVSGPNVSIAHGVWVTEDEMALMAETGTAVSHNPSSNLRLRAGTAPLNAYLAAGVTTGIGLDNTAIGDDDDMFAEMRLALRLARSPTYREPAPSNGDVLALATTGGAKLMRRDHELGRLAEGYLADIVLVRLDRIAWPWIAPEADPRDLVLLRARADDVDKVLISGELVLDDGRPTRFDIDEVGLEAAALMAETAYPDDAARVAAALIPHIEAWYAGWDHKDRVAYQPMNSRV